MVQIDSVLGLDSLDEDLQSLDLVQEAIAAAASHGLLMLAPGTKDLYIHAPLSLLPNDFPLEEYLRAVRLAPLFNTLIERVAADGAWMLDVLRSVLPHDDFTRKLVDIYNAVDGKGKATQRVHLGINRSDYMLDGESLETSRILQVEVNTIASSMGSLSTRISRLHRYLMEKVLQRPATQLSSPASYVLPYNSVTDGLARALSLAHAEYCRQRDMGPRDDTAVVLMVVQTGERNVMDQRMLEVALWERHGVRVRRATLKEVAMCGSLADRKVEKEGPVLKLSRGSGEGEEELVEVSVAYFRAGYTPLDYPSPLEWDGRALIERSMAIKCPCISYHLAGTKKVQEALSRPGELERFLPDPADSSLLRSCFAGLYGLEEGNVEGAMACRLALTRPMDFVLKPQREGGGNNVYGEEMVTALKTMGPEERSAYILMDRIRPPEQRALLLRDGKLIEGSCVYELGIYGIYLSSPHGPRACPLLNQATGHNLRTKLATANEGGVAAGFAVLSSPLLVGDLTGSGAHLDLLPPPSEEEGGKKGRCTWCGPALQAALVGSGLIFIVALCVGASRGGGNGFRRDSGTRA